MKIHSVVGIDEAGRGPLAGPVAVGAVHIPRRSKLSLLGLKDSKQLTPAERERWFARMKEWHKEGKLFFAVSLVSAKIIDTKGIAFAIRLGINRSLGKLGLDPRGVEVYLDGGLRAPDMFMQKTIIKGDEKIPAIALASIAAKVTRDRKMERFSLHYPSYGFEIHKGYGTEKHRSAIRKQGACDIHRMSFIRTLTGRESER